jgi:endonuclease YncB( thermonuclease family)
MQQLAALDPDEARMERCRPVGPPSTIAADRGKIRRIPRSTERMLMRPISSLRLFRCFVLFFSLLVVDPAVAPLLAESSSGKVVDVASNGDLYLSNGTKLRLMGIDLPSTYQCFGDERLAYMREHLVGKTVDYAIEKHDLLGKSLAYVNAGGDVGADLIYMGYGFALRSFKYSKQDRYRGAEGAAMKAGRGLWTKCEVDCSDRGCETESRIFGCGR